MGVVQRPIGDTPEITVYTEGTAALVILRHGPWIEAAVIADGVVRKHVQQWEADGGRVTRAVEVV